ncbi:aldehyde dehydrogenase family protein [Pandoraea communis]|uniref:Aldehyde dehydrogenase n=1 Tax=Pandoraea communis TaxID=2508297 RepID=A0A5E4RRD0_9BURK|nr:aldehyde dehydrogenase family protein [Pandoraea communis]MDM8355827.1 aldehyde dehydrogenase family protein [Pandoraea communis]VVD64428.1 aldehyde dehydrogenase [Pandoraea communis]
MDSFDPAQVSIRSGHFIDGSLVDAGNTYADVICPSSGRPYAALAMADADMVDHAASRAWHAFRHSGWATCAPRERARVLRRLADLVEGDVATLAPLEAIGSTRPVRDAAAWDVPYTAECLRFYAEHADKHGGEVAATDPSLLGMTITEPIGVVGAIAPWNFPLVMAIWKAAPALAAGNAIVIKPSEMTPFSVLRLAELAIQAGVPAGIFNVIQGDGRVTGDALVRHPRVGKVTFTGSTRTGAAIMTACAQTGTKPVTLELGGKSPQVVFADVPDLDAVARRIAMGITGNAGQVCNAGSRLLVEAGIADALIERLAPIFGALRPGATWAAGTTLSPIISAAQAQRIGGLVDRAGSAGADVVCGGKPIDGGTGGAWYAPTILRSVDAHAEIVREEVFGPVLTVQTFTTEEEALQLAQHEDYGLAAGVHTANLGRAMRMVRGIDAGNVWVNRYGRSSDFVLPTGGFKRSGLGKDLGRQAFEANLRSKAVLIDLNG